MRSRSRSHAGLFASLTLVFIACGGRSTIDYGLDDGSSTTGGVGATGGSGGGGGSGGTGAISGGGGTPSGGGVSGGGTGGGGLCEDPGGSPCELCTCSNCYDELEKCDDDGGCMEILACADKTGCSGVQCYLGECKDVIDQNGGPFGGPTAIAQGVVQCRGAKKCPCGGGTGGAGGGGGSGGSGASGGSGGGSGGTGPVACVTCIAQKCPAVQQCLFDTKCRDGVICATQKCTSGGGGQPNLQCMLGCFNGDFQAALAAFQSLQCFFTSCGQTCGGLIPGLPSGGTPPGGGN